MKIKTRLRLSKWIAAGTFIIMLAAMAWSLFESARAFQNLELINELRKVAAERIMLRDEYLLHQEERAKIQWQAKSETLRGLLDMADTRFADQKDKALLTEARKAYEATFISFSRFLDEHRLKKRTAGKILDFTESEARLIGQVFLKAYVLSDNIMQLHSANQKKAKTARVREALIIVLFIMSGGIMIFVNTTFIDKLLRRKITALADGMEIIGTGNLDYRIAETGDDELSELARAGNQMADKLKKSYTSVENLQKEITERKRVESQREAALEEIKKLNAELEQRVLERTAELAAKTTELQRINKVFVDRELRMRELKKRIAELEKNA